MPPAARRPSMSPRANTARTDTTPPPGNVTLRGLITDADLPEAETEWPGLVAFFRALPAQDRPPTFLELVWRFETRHALRHAA